MGESQLLAGRFRVERRVGGGGMGVVFRGRDETNGRAVAIKLLEGRDAVDAERANREVAALARLEHPAIVRYVADGVTPDGQIYLVMAWVDGVTVAERVAAEGFSLREAVAVARRIADALGSAHDIGVLHRDVKPSNVLLPGGDPAEATLIDFGVARVADARAAITHTGATIGTPGYMSPEQARGERSLTPAADVFGLGCLLHECATGRPAFSGTYTAAVLAKIVLASPTPLAELCPESPPELAALLARMLAKPIAERIARCRDVGLALDLIGPIAEGPRRSSREVVHAPTESAPRGARSAALGCVVSAAAGPPEDVLPPPSPDQCRMLVDVAERYGAQLEIVASGAIFAHVAGDLGDASRRAASLALAIRAILSTWSITISAADRDLAALVDASTVLLGRATLAAIFHRGASITIDRALASVLRDEFELDASDDGSVRLTGRSTRGA